MAIETSSTSMAVTSSSGVNQNSTSVSSKSSSDTSFKDEMDKVSSTENKDVKEAKNDTEKTVKETDTKNKKSETTEKTNKKDDNKDNKDLLLMDKIGFEDNKISFNDVNRMLVDDIQQMADIYGKFSDWNCSCADNKFTLSMNETDAQFFINLTNNEDVTIQNITAQAQNMLNSGTEAKEVQQGFQVSQTLLNALSEARQNNQPIRIDFDNNVAVVLRVNQNGAISANFIPGDKVVEQYLRQNIDILKNTFDEKNLPYTELSYSNSSREQNKRRREQQQGE